MNRTAVAISAFAFLMLLGGAMGTVSAATPGYVVYKVQFSSLGMSYSATVNETVATTSNASYDNLILSVMTGAWNSSYSRSINSSSEVSPFLPSITNQTFSFESGSTSLSASVSQSGTTQVQFQAKSYTLTSYSVSSSVSYNGSKYTAKGTLATFPSGLIDSVNVTTSTPYSVGSTGQPQVAVINVTVTLLSTSLPLNAPAASTATQAASIGIGAGAIVSALAIGLGVRYRGKHKNPVPEQKPEHWVD